MGQIARARIIKRKIRTYKESWWKKNWIFTTFGIIFFFTILMGFFQNNPEIPSYMTIRDVPNDLTDPFQKETVTLTEEISEPTGYRYLEYGTDDPLQVIMQWFGEMPVFFFIVITLPFVFVITKSVLWRRW